MLIYGHIFQKVKDQKMIMEIEEIIIELERILYSHESVLQIETALLNFVNSLKSRHGNEKMENEKINYETAQKEIENYESELTPFWKGTVGTHKVKFLSDLEKWKYTDKETQQDEDRAKIEIESDGEKHTWAMGIGKTPASAYGQLIALGKKFGTLIGVDAIVHIKNNGKRNDYTIIEQEVKIPEEKVTGLF